MVQFIIWHIWLQQYRVPDFFSNHAILNISIVSNIVLGRLEIIKVYQDFSINKGHLEVKWRVQQGYFV